MYRKQFEINRTFPSKVYLFLIILTFVTNIAVQPYQLALQGQKFLVFGLGHLPMLSASLAAMGLSLTPILIISTLTTNGIGGIVLGWLYWSRGLESAMIAHFTADITLHMIVPAILSLFR